MRKKKGLCLVFAVAFGMAALIPNISGRTVMAAAREKQYPAIDEIRGVKPVEGNFDEIRNVKPVEIGYDDPELELELRKLSGVVNREFGSCPTIEEIRSVEPVGIGYDELDVALSKVDAENASVLEEGDYPPLNFHNLAKGAYTYSFSDVYSYVYSEYYFDPSLDGYIAVTISGINGPVNIRMIDYSTGEVVHDWTGDPKTTGAVRFYGFPENFYYFEFLPAGTGPISGSGLICWPD